MNSSLPAAIESTDYSMRPVAVGRPLTAARVEHFAQLVAAGHLTLDEAYITAGFTKDHANPSRLAKRPDVAERIHALRAAIAERFVVSAAQLRMRQFEISTAPSLTQIRVYNCRFCHGTGFNYQWTDAIELARAMDAAMRSASTPRPLPFPDVSGGYGYDAFAAPNSQCPKCRGAGEPVVYVPDTTKLSGAELAAFKGVTVDRDGNPRVEQYDRQDAAFELHRLLGLVVTKTEGKQLSINASLDLNSPSTEDAARMTPAQLVAALWKPPAVSPAPADPVAVVDAQP